MVRKKYNLLKKGLLVGFIQNLIFVAPTLIISVLFSRHVATLFFTSSATTVSLDYTVVFLKYCLPLLVFNIVANYGYYAGWVFAWVFDAIVGIIIYFFGKWRLDILPKQPHPYGP